MLPDSEGWRRLHPLSPLLRGGRIVLVAALLGLQQLAPAIQDLRDEAGDGGLGGAELAALLAGGAAVVLAAVLGYTYLAWRFAGYRIHDDQLEVRKGVVFRSRGNVPIARVESVDVARPPVARLFGLAEVRVEVASQAGGEAELTYLSTAEAAQVGSELDRARRALRGGTGDVPEEPDPGVPLATVVDRDLFVAYGAPAATLAAAALLATALAAALAGLTAGLSLGVIALVTVGAAVYGSLRQIDRLHGFHLRRAGEELRIERGFLDTLTQQVPLARIQAVRIEEPLLWRPFRRARLLVDVAGYRGASGTRAAASAILLPIGDLGTVRSLLRYLGGPDPDTLTYEGPPRRARWRAPVRWRRYGAAQVPGFTVTRSGVLRRRVDLVTSEKLQSLRLSAGPWQRALGLVTLHLDTAGNRIVARAPHLEPEVATRLLWNARGVLS